MTDLTPRGNTGVASSVDLRAPCRPMRDLEMQMMQEIFRIWLAVLATPQCVRCYRPRNSKGLGFVAPSLLVLYAVLQFQTQICSKE